MKSFSIVAALAALFAAPLMADIVEQKIEFDADLGSAVLYYDDALEQPTAGVIVVHEWWGMDDYTRARARKLAEAGYAAVAVDMYGTGKVASHPKDAKSFMNAALADPGRMNARFAAARAVLAGQKMVDPERHYAIGYCFGGAVVLGQARMGASLAGVASFHGSLGTESPAQADTITARVLVATGGADPMVPAQQLADFVNEMSVAKVDFEVMSFPDAVHGFTNPGATEKGKSYDMPLAYDAEADQRSWQALMRFLAQ